MSVCAHLSHMHGSHVEGSQKGKTQGPSTVLFSLTFAENQSVFPLNSYVKSQTPYVTVLDMGSLGSLGLDKGMRVKRARWDWSLHNRETSEDSARLCLLCRDMRGTGREANLPAGGSHICLLSESKGHVIPGYESGEC